MFNMFCLNRRNFRSLQKVLKILGFFSLSLFYMEVISGNVVHSQHYLTDFFFYMKKADSNGLIHFYNLYNSSCGYKCFNESKNMI